MINDKEKLFDEFCDLLGIKLFPFQRQFMLNKVLNQEKIYLPIISHRGSSISFKEMAYMLSKFYKIPEKEVFLMLMSGEENDG